MWPKIVGDFVMKFALFGYCRPKEEASSAEEQLASNRVYQVE